MEQDSESISYLKSSMKKLSRFFFKVNTQLHRKKNHCLYRISFKKTSGLTSTFLHLTSQNQVRKMNYSLRYNEYYIEIWTIPRSEFYISQHSKAFLIDSYPQIVSKSKEYLNITPEPKKFSSFQLSHIFSRSFCKNFVFESSGCSVGKLSNLNEDAYFYNEAVLGVADGIGSLKTDFGISSKEFSQELMSKCEILSKQLRPTIKKSLCKEIINQAYSSLETGGGATVCLAALSGRQLNILNLGDSGLILLRFDKKFKIAFQTTPKYHKNNVPYQLTRKFTLKQTNLIKDFKVNLENTDTVEDADEFLITTVPGDLVIMGTDGLWDNLHSQEICKIVEQYKTLPISKIAAILAKVAKIRTAGLNKSFNFFNKQTVNENECVGGKLDDITVIVAQVKPKFESYNNSL